MQVKDIELKELKPSPTNPRQYFDDKKMADLAASIKDKGVMEPVIVRESEKLKGYEIIAGERRFRASKLAGKDTVPCIIKVMGDQQVVEFQIVENVQRDDLTPLEEAMGYKKLIDDFKYTMDDLTAKIGKSKSYINQRFRLLALSPKVKAALAKGDVQLAMAMELIRVPDHAKQDDLLRDLGVRGGYQEWDTAKDLRDYIDENLLLELAEAPFDTKDEKLGGPSPTPNKCISCIACPNRTGFQAGLFGDMGKKDVCLDNACWKRKVNANDARLVAKYKAEGKKVIVGEEAKKLTRNAGSKGLVRLDETDYKLKGDSTFRQVLKKNGLLEKIAVTLVQTDKGVEQYASKSQIINSLPKKAFENYHDGSSMSTKAKTAGPARKRRLLDLKASRAVWKPTWELAIEKVTEKELKGATLRALVSIFVKHVTPNNDADRRAGGKISIDSKLATAKNDADLKEILWQTALGCGLSFDDTSLTTQAKKVFDLAGVDWTAAKAKAAAQIVKDKAAKDAKKAAAK